jgi:post-segregation antitoxin (ccd killing protein)
MSAITDTPLVTTSFTVDEELLERARELAQRRGQSTSRLIVDALTAELAASETLGEHANGRPSTGGWTEPTVVGRQFDVGHEPLPMHERATRLAEVRRTFSGYRTILPSRGIIFGLPPECLAPRSGRSTHNWHA